MGILKMRAAMVAAGLREPTFEPDGFFRAIFHRASELSMKEIKEGSEKGFGEKFGENLGSFGGPKHSQRAGNRRDPGSDPSCRGETYCRLENCRSPQTGWSGERRTMGGGSGGCGPAGHRFVIQ